MFLVVVVVVLLFVVVLASLSLSVTRKKAKFVNLFSVVRFRWLFSFSVRDA